MSLDCLLGWLNHYCYNIGELIASTGKGSREIGAGGWSTLVLTPLLTLFSVAQAEDGNPETKVEADSFGRRVTLTDILTLREIGGMIGNGLSVSPDGAYVAFEQHRADIVDNDYDVAWRIASINSSAEPTTTIDAGDPTLFRYSSGAWLSDYAKWSPDSRRIAYRKRLGDETQVWWTSLDGVENRQITHNAADVEEYYWSRDGSKIYFSTDADRVELQLASVSRYRNGHIFDYEKNWSTIDGAPVYPQYLLTRGEPRVWTFEVASEVERLATADELVEFHELKHPDASLKDMLGARYLARTNDARGVAWFQADDPDRQGYAPPLTLYASLAADGSDVIRCPAPECTGPMDIGRLLRRGLHWETTDDEILFVRKEGMAYSTRSLYGWRVGEPNVRKIFSTNEWVSDCSIVRGSAICFRETPVRPRTVVAIDLANNSTTILYDPNPGFDSIEIGEVEFFEWDNDDGHGTFGYVVKPLDFVPGRRYPLILVGYRARMALRGGTGNEYPVHVLAANGFVVLVYERPTHYEAYEVYDDSIDLARARWGLPELFDVRAPLASFESAIQILSDRGLVDPTRVAITGLSNGVGHVNYSLIHSDLFSAAITSSSEWGPNNRVLIGAAGDEAREYLRAIGIGGPYPGPHAFLFPHMSLALNADRVDAPLLVNTSDAEHPQALEEIVALLENNKPVEMVVYPDEDHIKWHPAHRASIYERNVDWLNFWLRGVEDASARKVDQYSRWRKLRDKHYENRAAKLQ